MQRIWKGGGGERRSGDRGYDERINGTAGDVEGGCAWLHTTTQKDVSAKCI